MDIFIGDDPETVHKASLVCLCLARCSPTVTVRLVLSGFEGSGVTGEKNRMNSYLMNGIINKNRYQLDLCCMKNIYENLKFESFEDYEHYEKMCCFKGNPFVITRMKEV